MRARRGEQPASSRNLRQGFTLMEIMIAMAITVTIVILLVSISSTAMEIWSRNRSEVRASRQAKAMADAMSRDFDAMVIRSGNANQWLWAEANVPDDGPNPGSRSPNGARLIFFSAATDRYDGKAGEPGSEGKGNISTIIYEVHYRNPTGKTSSDLSTFVLYRKILDPDSTFENVLGKTDLVRAVSDSSGAVGDLENFICENIYQFTATFHISAKGSDEKKRTFQIPLQVGPNGGGRSVPRFGVFGNRIEADISESRDLPAEAFRSAMLTGIEISMTVLTDAALEQMRRRKFRSDDERASFVEKNSYQYSKLIGFPQG